MESFSLNIELISEASISVERNFVAFSSVPMTFQEVIEKVEKNFSIPPFSQVLRVNGKTIQHPRTETLSSFSVQNGDFIQIHYPIKCECQKVKDAIKWLSDSIEVFRAMNESIPEEASAIFKNSVSKLSYHNLNSTALADLFDPLMDEAKSMNCSYFDHLNGIDLLVNFHNGIQSVANISELKSFADSFEHFSCVAFAFIARNNYFRRKITDAGGLECCLTSFFKFTNYELKKYRYGYICMSLDALTNLSDTLENQLLLSGNSELIARVVEIIGMPSKYVTVKPADIGIRLLIILAKSKEAREILIRNRILQGIVKAVNERINSFRRIPDLLDALEFFSGVFLAEMVLGSVQLLINIPENDTDDIIRSLCNIRKYNLFRIKVFNDISACVVHISEVLICLYQFDWSSLNSLSCVRHSSNLYLSSAEVLLLFLQGSINEDVYIKQIKEDNLMDYIVMLQWIVPKEIRDQALDVIEKITSNGCVQPPSLSSIAKAKLSKSHKDLKYMLETPLSRILADLV